MLGYFDPRLPAPPSETSYSLVLQVEVAVLSFHEAAAIPNLRTAASTAVGVCEAAQVLATRYTQEGVAAHKDWAGARAEVANWQRALAAEALGFAAGEAAGALSEATAEFEAAHRILHDGGGGISEIIPERQDLLQVWREIDAAWAKFKIETQGQNIGSMAASFDELDALLTSAVPLFGIADVPNPPTSPLIFVATYSALGVTLTFCGCAGCFMFYRSRRKAEDHQEGGPSSSYA